METVEAHVGKMEAELKQWGTRLDNLQAAAEVAGTAARVDYRQRLENLREKYLAAEKKFTELKAAGTSKWETLQGAVEAAWSELEAAFTKLANLPRRRCVAERGKDVMAHLPVRRSGGERGGTAPVVEPQRMRLDPCRQEASFSTGGEAPTRFMPDFQIEKTEDTLVFKAELLGIKENEVDVAVTGDRLTISGHLYDPRACSYAGFTRAFTLPEGSIGDKQVRAALDGGALTVTFSTLSGDDFLERWEWEGGLAR